MTTPSSNNPLQTLDTSALAVKPGRGGIIPFHLGRTEPNRNLLASICHVVRTNRRTDVRGGRLLLAWWSDLNRCVLYIFHDGGPSRERVVFLRV